MASFCSWLFQQQKFVCTQGFHKSTTNYTIMQGSLHLTAENKHIYFSLHSFEIKTTAVIRSLDYEIQSSRKPQLLNNLLRLAN